jgi:hypothetical protein
MLTLNGTSPRRVSSVLVTSNDGCLQQSKQGIGQDKTNTTLFQYFGFACSTAGDSWRMIIVRPPSMNHGIPSFRIGCVEMPGITVLASRLARDKSSHAGERISVMESSSSGLDMSSCSGSSPISLFAWNGNNMAESADIFRVTLPSCRCSVVGSCRGHNMAIAFGACDYVLSGTFKLHLSSRMWAITRYRCSRLSQL